MSPKFWVGFSAFTTSTAFKTAIKIIGAASKSWELYEVGMYGAGTIAPADGQTEIRFAVGTNGAAGTPGASPTPEKVVQIAAVTGLTAGTAYSAEGTTITTNQFTLMSFNTRGGMRWAVPLGMGFQPDATQLSGNVGCIASVAGRIDGNAFWNE
jgi:hypothetical protein